MLISMASEETFTFSTYVCRGAMSAIMSYHRQQTNSSTLSMFLQKLSFRSPRNKSSSMRNSSEVSTEFNSSELP